MNAPLFELSSFCQSTIIEVLPPQHLDYQQQQDILWTAIFKFYNEKYINKIEDVEDIEENNSINPLVHIYHVKPLPEKKDISVQQIRDMIEWAIMMPKQENTNHSEHKWVIIENLEQLNLSASNCLLKILEEPPEFLSFLLLTHKLETTLMTIRSRCQLIRAGDKTDYLNEPLNEKTHLLFNELPKKASQVCSWVKKNKPIYAELVSELQRISVFYSNHSKHSEHSEQNKKWLKFYRQLYNDCENISFFNQGSLSKELACEQLLFKYCEVFA